VGLVDSLSGVFLMWLFGMLLVFLLLLGLARGKRALAVDFKLFGAELKIKASRPGSDLEAQAEQ